MYNLSPMAFKRANVEKWTETAAPGERFVNYVGTGQNAAPTLTHVTTGSDATVVHSSEADLGDNRRLALSDSLGLDRGRQLEQGKATTFYALTDRQLILGTRSSVRDRPKEMLHAARLDDVEVHRFDHDHDAGSGNRNRHFVTLVGDGYWRGDRTGPTALGRELKASNANDFLAALGNRAVEATEA